MIRGTRIQGDLDRFSDWWKQETFLKGVFGPMDFDEYLDDPETGYDDPIFAVYSKEITDYMLPTDIGLEEYIR